MTMVTSSGHWLAGYAVLLQNGFRAVDHAPPSFSLLVKRFGDAPLPSFPTDWEDRLGRCGPGLTIVRSDQWPYVESVSQAFSHITAEMDIASRAVELTSSRQAQELAPSAYGVFNVVFDGKLLAYHWISEKALHKLLQERTP